MKIPSRTNKAQGRRTGIPRFVWVVLLFSLWPALARPAERSDPQEILRQLHEVTLDPAQVYVVRNVRLTRDRVGIYLNRGFVVLFRKVADEITGALFVGDGEILLIPSHRAEKYSLVQFTGAPLLEERFTAAVLRFTDHTAKELLGGARLPEPDDPDQPTDLVAQWERVVQAANASFALRILQDLLGERGSYFHAQFHGRRLGLFQLTVDGRSSEGVRLGAATVKQDVTFYDIWYSYPTRVYLEKKNPFTADPFPLHQCRTNIQINPDHSLEGLANLELESRGAAERLVAFELSRFLRVSEVQDDRGNILAFFQNPSLAESEVAARGNDLVFVVLPSPPEMGQRLRLKFAYRGQVIADVGNGVLYVGARGSWYPHRGLLQRTNYDLSFRYPERLTLVASGRRVEESSEGGWKQNRWISEQPLPIAGFNLGPYESRTRQSGKVRIEVYAAPAAEDVLERRARAAQMGRMSPSTIEAPGRRREVVILPPPVLSLTPSARLDTVADNATRAVEHFESLFGPFPFGRLAICQIPGNYGQGWPELVYLPTLSFLSSTERTLVGLPERSATLQEWTLLAHEIGHQWWGNAVGWKSYHDQWLSEGFASYAAALHLATEKDGAAKFRELMQSYKEDLLRKTPDGESVESGGPIWLGYRLQNSKNPFGYQTIVYMKGCWVLHMLRMLMRASAPNPDEKFFGMLRDFVDAYRGASVSTEDFVRHVEKYITPALDLDRNGRLEWFFNSWVYGTGIPTYRLQAGTRAESPTRFVLRGEIQQSDVPEDFEMLVPLVATDARGKKTDLGWVRVDGEGGRFRFTLKTKPIRVTIDEERVLAVTRP